MWIRINSFRSDSSGWIGAVVMSVFAAIAAWRWSESGLLFFALTTLRDLAATWFFLVRTRVGGERRFGKGDVLAYISSGVPLFYLSPMGEVNPAIVVVSSIMVIVGFGLATVALFELGSSFGVGPANRGEVRSGIYGWIAHPMYFGYVVAELGCVVTNPMNGFLFVCSTSLYFWRANLETEVLKPRAQYG